MLNIALPKGRLGERVYGIFENAGLGVPSVNDGSRRLTFEDADVGVRYFWVKPSDVAIYVERGAADLGVAGKDILLEYRPDVYELLDLGIGKCRMASAGKSDFQSYYDSGEFPLRVATKFPNIARDFFASRGRSIDIIKLHGSIELAPLLGLSDIIVDIVETGETLRENGLIVIEDIVEISARLIANKASHKFDFERIEGVVGSVAKIKEKK